MLLLVLAHVDTHQRLLIVEQELGQGARRLGLADAGRAKEQERAKRPIRILQAGARGAHGVGHGQNGLLLADDALAEALFHGDELFDFALHQLAHGYARPAADDLSDVLLSHFFLYECAPVTGALALLLLGRRASLLQLTDFVLQSSRTLPISALCRLIQLDPLAVELFLGLGDRVELLQLRLPLRFERAGLLLEAGELLFDALQALPGGRVLLLAQALTFDLELHDATTDFVQLGGRAGGFHAQPRGGLVDQVDRLVRQEAIRDVTVREHRRGHQRRVADADLVVLLVALAQAAQNGDRVLDTGLADEDGLEAALQGGIFLDVLSIFVERGGTNAVQLAAGQHRLEHVGGVHSAFGGARPDHRVQLVDEQDDLAG